MFNCAKFLLPLLIILTMYAGELKAQGGKPAEIQVTAYKTTMLGNGKDDVLITAKIIDNKGKEVPGITKSVTYKIVGDASLVSVNNTNAQSLRLTDSTWKTTLNGTARIIITSGADAWFHKI
jgi:arabinogalactan endo-1,4-beta-galactosidase